MLKVKIGETEDFNFIMEGFPTPTTMNAEMILRSKIHYLYKYPRYDKIYHGESDKIPIDVVTQCFTIGGWQEGLAYADNPPWIIITKEPRLKTTQKTA